MNILAITCWCGGQDYADMTARMLRELQESLEATGPNYSLSVVEQGVPEGTKLPFELCKDEVVKIKKNGGFAVGMNRALQHGMRYGAVPDALLCLNNDILMPDPGWLAELVNELQDDSICCPTTNYTSVNEQRASGSADKDPFWHGVTPAVCWLFPWSIVEMLMEHLGGVKIFPEDLGGRAWGEDNYTAGVVRGKVRRDPFKIVPRSWINHLGSKTSCKIPAPERMAAHKEAHARLKREGF